MTLYEILGLTAKATAVQIKAAHRQAVKTHHPDVGGDVSKFEQAQRAYFILSDTHRRERYDNTGIEDDAVTATEEQLAQSAIAALIVQFISSNDDLNTTDIVTAIRNTLLKQKTGHYEVCSQMNVRLQRVETIRSRLHRKDNEHGALAALLNERERELQLNKSREQSQIGVIERALSLLDDYSYRLDPTPAEEAKIWFALKP